jgi:predicted secreted Zn-dependent protease
MGSIPGHRASGETDLGWRRASRCSNSGCVEVAMNGDEITVRDAKRADSPVLTYSREEWRVFLAGVKAGEFDLS